jgi:hypothetical protein
VAKRALVQLGPNLLAGLPDHAIETGTRVAQRGDKALDRDVAAAKAVAVDQVLEDGRGVRFRRNCASMGNPPEKPAW